MHPEPAKTPSLPASELADASALAQDFGWRHQIIETQEVSDPRYAANDARRCYFCKTNLYDRRPSRRRSVSRSRG